MSSAQYKASTDLSREQQLGAPRRVTAADAAAPAVESGWDVAGWQQVVLVVEATAVGRAEVQIWRQYQLQSTVGGDIAPNFVMGEYVDNVGLFNHTGLYRGPATFLINTLGADRLTALVAELQDGTAVTLHVFGVTRADGAPLPGALSSKGPDTYMVSDAVNAFHTTGSAKDLTASLVAGSWINCEGAVEGLLGMTVGGDAATSVDIQVAWSPDGGTTIFPLGVVNNISGGSVDTDDNLYVCPGTVAKHAIQVALPPRGSVCFYAKATGSGGTTTLLAVLYPYKV